MKFRGDKMGSKKFPIGVDGEKRSRPGRVGFGGNEDNYGLIFLRRPLRVRLMSLYTSLIGILRRLAISARIECYVSEPAGQKGAKS